MHLIIPLYIYLFIKLYLSYIYIYIYVSLSLSLSLYTYTYIYIYILEAYRKLQNHRPGDSFTCLGLSWNNRYSSSIPLHAYVDRIIMCEQPQDAFSCEDLEDVLRFALTQRAARSSLLLASTPRRCSLVHTNTPAAARTLYCGSSAIAFAVAPIRKSKWGTSINAMIYKMVK